MVLMGLLLLKWFSFDFPKFQCWHLTPLSQSGKSLRIQFAQDAFKQTQWKAFLRKNGLGALALGDVVARLRHELEMIGVI
jgi:hypothetical protein